MRMELVDVAELLHEDTICITPHPILTRLERPNNRMSGSMVMPGGVPVLRRVAASDMAAAQADPEMHPGVTGREAFSAATRAGGDLLDRIEMCACVRHGRLLFFVCEDSQCAREPAVITPSFTSSPRPSAFDRRFPISMEES